MVLTGGLFKRFKCLATSSFCLEALSLAAEEREINTPHKQKTRTRVTPQPQLEPITKTPFKECTFKLNLGVSKHKLTPLKTLQE